MFSELIGIELPLIKTLSQRLGWEYIPYAELDKLRDSYEIPFIIPHLTEAIVKLNGERGINSEHAEAIIHKLRQIQSNEEFRKWLKGEESFAPSSSEAAIPIRLIDTDNLNNNRFTVTNQFRQTVTRGKLDGEKHITPDIVLLVNGIPTTVIECKAPPTEHSALEKGIQQLERYQFHNYRLFAPNCFNVSTDGCTLKYGATGASPGDFYKWLPQNGLPTNFGESQSEFAQARDDGDYNPDIDKAVFGLFNRETYIDLIQNFIVVETDGDATIKRIARYHQFRAANTIVDRVVEGKMKTGLVLHAHGSGKLFTMLFTAWKLRKHPALNDPTVLLLFDRQDSKDNPLSELRHELAEKDDKVIAATILSSGELEETLAERDNLIVLVDEAHRNKEGRSAIEMLDAFKNARIIGFTDAPIARSDQKIRQYFEMDPDGTTEGYIDQYRIKQAIEDSVTVPVYYQMRNTKWHMAADDIPRALEENLIGTSSEPLATFMESAERIEAVAADIAEHFTKHVAPNGYKAQVVCYSKKTCVELKRLLDKKLGPEISDVIVVVARDNDDDETQKPHYSSEQQKETIRNFKSPEHELKILLVQDMPLEGFDATVQQVLYLDRPLRNHTLLQAIASTNQPHGDKKCGIIIDYCGILGHLDKALDFDEGDIEGCLMNFDELKHELADLINEFKEIFSGVESSNLSQCLTHIFDNKLVGTVTGAFKALQRTWETISPDPSILEHQKDYKWALRLLLALRQIIDNRKPNLTEYPTSTQRFIQDQIDMNEIDRTAPIFVADKDFRRRTDELPPDRHMREILVENGLRSVLANRLNFMPVYQTLLERLNSITRRHDHETTDTLDLLVELTGEVHEAIRQEAVVGLSKGAMAFRQLVVERVQPDDPTKLLSLLTDVILGRTFPNWQTQLSVHSAIRGDIEQELAKYVEENPSANLSPDDYATFSRDAIKYAEMYF